MLQYLNGNVVTDYDKVGGRKILVHCVNTSGIMGSGVALAIKKEWPNVFTMYHDWHRAGRGISYIGRYTNNTQLQFMLGKVQLVRVENDLLVANMIAQTEPRGCTIDGVYLRPIRLESLKECMLRVRALAKESEATIIGPKFCSERAGGDWDKEIVPLIEDIWKDVPVTIFKF